MYWEILDKKRLEAVSKFSFFREVGFYLAGGTALALQLGHRDSIDFDFFTEQDFDKEKITNYILENFKDVSNIQNDINTLTFIIEKDIKLSFFKYRYKLVGNIINTDSINVASVEDIACMKLNAICNRNTLKDYVDLFFILKKIPLEQLIEIIKIKMPEIDPLLILKSLVYFDDIIQEPIIFKTKEISITEIKEYIIKTVFDYQTNINQ